MFKLLEDFARWERRCVGGIGSEGRPRDSVREMQGVNLIGGATLGKLGLVAVLLLFSLSGKAADDAEAITNIEELFHGEAPISVVSQAETVGWRDRLSIGGYVKNETAYRLDEPRSITKIRNIFQVNGDYAFSPNSRLGFSAWAYHDLAYDLFDYETITGRFARDDDKPLVFVNDLDHDKDSPVAELREFYLDITTSKVDVRLGKQIVVWGVLEGIRITDEINPLDFRELILPDLLDYRIPLWMAKVDVYKDDDSYQVLWIPDVRFHEPAPPGSEWELLQDVPNTKEPNSFTLENSEFGLRYSTSVLDTEISLSYFYTWDDFPVVYRSAAINSALDPVFFPTYTRINIYGFTGVRQLGSGILKGELAYVPDKFFGLQNDTDRDGDGYLDSQGELQRKHIRWGLGYDFTRFGADFSPAISQWIILGHDSKLIQDKFDTSLTLFIRKPLPEQAAVLQLLAIGLVNLQELYLKPEVIFSITDHFQIAAGFDIFTGAKSKLGSTGGANAITSVEALEQSAQFFGNFNNNDRVFAEFKYTF